MKDVIIKSGLVAIILPDRGTHSKIVSDNARSMMAACKVIGASYAKLLPRRYLSRVTVENLKPATSYVGLYWLFSACIRSNRHYAECCAQFSALFDQHRQVVRNIGIISGSAVDMTKEIVIQLLDEKLELVTEFRYEIPDQNLNRGSLLDLSSSAMLLRAAFTEALKGGYFSYQGYSQFKGGSQRAVGLAILLEAKRLNRPNLESTYDEWEYAFYDLPYAFRRSFLRMSDNIFSQDVFCVDFKHKEQMTIEAKIYFPGQAMDGQVRETLYSIDENNSITKGNCIAFRWNPILFEGSSAANKSLLEGNKATFSLLGCGWLNIGEVEQARKYLGITDPIPNRTDYNYFMSFFYIVTKDDHEGNEQYYTYQADGSLIDTHVSFRVVRKCQRTFNGDKEVSRNYSNIVSALALNDTFHMARSVARGNARCEPSEVLIELCQSDYRKFDFSWLIEKEKNRSSPAVRNMVKYIGELGSNEAFLFHIVNRFKHVCNPGCLVDFMLSNLTWIRVSPAPDTLPGYALYFHFGVVVVKLI